MKELDECEDVKIRGKFFNKVRYADNMVINSEPQREASDVEGQASKMKLVGGYSEFSTLQEST